MWCCFVDDIGRRIRAVFILVCALPTRRHSQPCSKFEIKTMGICHQQRMWSKQIDVIGSEKHYQNKGRQTITKVNISPQGSNRRTSGVTLQSCEPGIKDTTSASKTTFMSTYMEDYMGFGRLLIPINPLHTHTHTHTLVRKSHGWHALSSGRRLLGTG